MAAHSVSSADFAPLLARARVTLNFHPDRVRRDGKTVAEGLLADGFYRSQFETGVTNGSPTAYSGGNRDRWEELLFGGAYQASGAERPKYGAFNVMEHVDGGSPRFGSCHLVLRRETSARCTFCWGDSHAGPAHVGTLAELDDVLAAWVEAIARDGAALGVTTTLRGLFEREASTAHGRALDDYIEAQVHGPIDLSRDIEALVIDPSFGNRLDELGERFGFPVRRHPGFVLTAGEIDDDFRGPRMRPLARRIAGDGPFDVARVGEAARSLAEDPAAWSDWDTPPETWQHLKQLWHCLVRFGSDRAER